MHALPSVSYFCTTTAVALALASAACGDDDAGAEEVAASAETAPAPAQPAPSQAMAGHEEVDLEIDPGALPSGELTVEAFAEDTCTLATAEQMDAFLGFVEGVSMESDDGLTGGSTCTYEAGDPSTTIEVQWEHSMSESDATETIAGKSGIEVDVSSSTLQSFARTRMRLDHGQTGFDILVVQIHLRDGVVASEDSLRALIEALTGSLVERMGLAESGD